MLNSLYFEFDYPPSKMIIYTGEKEEHLLPYKFLDFSSKILKNLKSKILMTSEKVEFKSSQLVKIVKLKFINEMRIPLKVKFLKVRKNEKIT
jgi:hypothetical protein